jgi:exodeoxyribonuclease VII small subunit
MLTMPEKEIAAMGLQRKGEAPEKELTFEGSLERLESIVQELEKGDLPLERSIELFEEGMQLSVNCRKKLEEAENRVEILLKKSDGKIVAEPFRINDSEKNS